MVLKTVHIDNFLLVLILQLLIFSCQAAYSPTEEITAQLPDTVDFNFHIKPILSDRCFACHGPDREAMKAELRLDTKAGALEHRLSSGQRAFVAGNIQKSEAFQRIISTDPELQMPPSEFQRQLSPYEIALLAKWIEQGAIYKPHWAFIPPTKAEFSEINNETWSRNAIDHFILEKLQENGLDPNEKADKETLLRRLTLDLTGLLPTLAEIDAFMADERPNAYEKVVDRLLSSPHFGERMALRWLDLARYADSNGYSQDGLRTMWPWRDWVIKAFNENMPFDQFIAWQIAGDKLPNATQEQKLATGFLRNHRQNGEGGIVDEEYRVEYAADRTETAAIVFLGLTMQCARCHDHKYDPISQEEYYQFFSFFNSVHETGITANDGNSGPEVVLSTKEVQEQIDFIDRMIKEKEGEAQQIATTLPASRYQAPSINLHKGLMVDLSFDQMDKEQDQDLLLGGTFQLSGAVTFEEGVQGKAVRVTGYDFIRIIKDEVDFDRADAFSASLYLRSHHAESNLSLLNHLGSKGDNFPGYEMAIDEGHPTLRLMHSYPAIQIEVRGKEKINKKEWVHLTFSYDGSGKAAGITIYKNGKAIPLNIRYDKLSQGIANGRKVLTVGGRRPYQTNHDGYAYIDELKIYNRQLSAVEAAALYPATANAFNDLPAKEKKEHYLATIHPSHQEIQRKIQALRQEKFSIQDSLISVMVMEDLPEPRPTFILTRGAYDAPSKLVKPGTPAAIPPNSGKNLHDRADLSQWLLDPKNPLTARVAVNRFWQHFFGQGIVKTTDDFGNQGALPTHPELLDWLAVNFVESGWDLKALLRMIVLSASYQQSSRSSLEKRSQDADNLLLSRGPSRRLSAELIRDAALTASGLLTRNIGGPSVKPYQPEGLWSEKGEFSQLKHYKQSHGADLYRRSLYTFWRRTSPPPSMTTFDAPTRDICIASRQETNTPLQALVMLNDPQFVEAARVLAESVIRETTDKTDQIIRAYRLLTGLQPKPETVSLLNQLEEKEFQKYRVQSELGRALLAVGEFPRDQTLAPAKVAAMTIVCSTIMSFDETLVQR